MQPIPFRRVASLLTLAVLFLTALVLRVEYQDHTSLIQPVRGDAAEYAVIGLNLANGRGFTLEGVPEMQGRPVVRPPGYPYFLAAVAKVNTLFEAFYRTVLRLQAVLGALTVLLAFALARQYLPFGWSIGVCALVLFSPHLISLTNYLLSETLFTFFLTASLLVFLLAGKRGGSWPLFAGAGLLMGATLAVRTSILALPPFLAFMAWWPHRREGWRALRGPALFVALSFALYVPWQAWAKTHVPQSPSEPSLVLKTLYVGSYINLTYRNPDLKGMPYREDPKFDEVIRRGYGGVLSEIAGKWSREPLRTTWWWVWGKQAFFWAWGDVHAGDIQIYPSRYSWYDNNGAMALTKIIMRGVHPVSILFLYLGAVLFLAGRFPRDKSLRLPVLALFAVIFYFLALHVVLTPTARYAFPLKPMVFLVGVLIVRDGWLWWVSRGKGKKAA